VSDNTDDDASMAEGDHVEAEEENENDLAREHIDDLNNDDLIDTANQVSIVSQCIANHEFYSQVAIEDANILAKQLRAFIFVHIDNLKKDDAVIKCLDMIKKFCETVLGYDKLKEPVVSKPEKDSNDHRPTWIGFIGSLVVNRSGYTDESILRKICERLFLFYVSIILLSVKRGETTGKSTSGSSINSGSIGSRTITVNESLLHAVFSIFRASLDSVAIFPKTDYFSRLFRETCGTVACTASVTGETKSNDSSFDFLSPTARIGQETTPEESENRGQEKKSRGEQICGNCGQKRKGHKCLYPSINMVHKEVKTELLPDDSDGTVMTALIKGKAILHKVSEPRNNPTSKPRRRES
jgi:hypothetical protein